MLLKDVLIGLAIGALACIVILTWVVLVDMMLTAAGLGVFERPDIKVERCIHREQPTSLLQSRRFWMSNDNTQECPELELYSELEFKGFRGQEEEQGDDDDEQCDE